MTPAKEPSRQAHIPNTDAAPGTMQRGIPPAHAPRMSLSMPICEKRSSFGWVPPFSRIISCECVRLRLPGRASLCSMASPVGTPHPFKVGAPPGRHDRGASAHAGSVGRSVRIIQRRRGPAARQQAVSIERRARGPRGRALVCNTLVGRAMISQRGHATTLASPPASDLEEPPPRRGSALRSALAKHAATMRAPTLLTLCLWRAFQHHVKTKNKTSAPCLACGLRSTA